MPLKLFHTGSIHLFTSQPISQFVAALRATRPEVPPRQPLGELACDGSLMLRGLFAFVVITFMPCFG